MDISITQPQRAGQEIPANYVREKYALYYLPFPCKMNSSVLILTNPTFNLCAEIVHNAQVAAHWH